MRGHDLALVARHLLDAARRSRGRGGAAPPLARRGVRRVRRAAVRIGLRQRRSLIASIAAMALRGSCHQCGSSPRRSTESISVEFRCIAAGAARPPRRPTRQGRRPSGRSGRRFATARDVARARLVVVGVGARGRMPVTSTRPPPTLPARGRPPGWWWRRRRARARVRRRARHRSRPPRGRARPRLPGGASEIAPGHRSENDSQESCASYAWAATISRTWSSESSPCRDARRPRARAPPPRGRRRSRPGGSCRIRSR